MLIRMISSIKKWSVDAYPINRADASFPGDSVTDLKTTRNKLSVWKADNDEEINDAIVALALGRQSIDKLWFVYLDESHLDSIGITAKPDETGDAPGIASQDILARHMNLQDIDYPRLGKLTEYIYSQLDSEKFTLKTVPQLSTLLNSYKEKGIVLPGNVNDKLKQKLKW